jgi:eukaryotic-like serine/threonine-protein kinase
MIQTGLPATGDVPVVFVPHVAKSICRAGQWELIEFAGLGSLAHVFRARPVGSPEDRPANYAVKMLRPCWEDDENAIRLLQREALVGGSVSNAHLISVLAASVLKPPRLLVMPWLEGASLGARLADGQQFDAAEALWVARQTAGALDALHAAGWIHGDVSPANIHISSNGHVTLLDLSFARRRDEIGSAVDRPIMGTCAYLAPEYLTSALRPDIRSDIYSLGAVLLEALSGRRPFECESLEDLALQHRQSAPLDLAPLAPQSPREILQFVRRMMAKDPLRRPQTPRELIDRLVALEIDAFSQRTNQLTFHNSESITLCPTSRHASMGT